MALLEVENLSTTFYTRNGVSTAVDNVSFTVEKGQILGIVGESGSGKSVCCYSLLGLVPSPPGRIESGSARFQGQDLLNISEAQLRAIRGQEIAMIFQDPMTSLNPYLTVGEQLIEPLIYHSKAAQKRSRKMARQQAIALLEEVGIAGAASRIDNYPHEFSGGMRQRVMIAMALISEPKLLIADEPTTALDVTIQAQILELLASLRQRHDITVIFISHDLAVIREVADEVVVMQAGKIVERGQVDAVFNAPQHAYTKALINAIPRGAKADNSTAPATADALITVNNLCTSFTDHSSGNIIRAVVDASFDVRRGEILGLVGESGSGKSTLGRSLLRLQQAQSGSVAFDNQQLLQLSRKAMLPYRRRMQMIFQDPYASLNPRMTVYDTLAEPLLYHGIATASNVSDRVVELMDDVGLERRFVRKYPHEFSGGQRQRIAIGRAIATRPEFIVADEPVSALDVTIQQQILALLLELVAKHSLTMLFISHDLAVVRALCDRVMVMRAGVLLERGDTESIWHQPQHEYTRELLASAVL